MSDGRCRRTATATHRQGCAGGACRRWYGVLSLPSCEPWSGLFWQGPIYRFDDPAGVYGVLYAAHQLEGAFAETHLRKPGRRYVDRSDLAARRWSRLHTVRSLRLLPLHGRYLAQVGATAEVTHGPADRYDLPRRWSSEARTAGFDGIEYRSRHDDDQLCLALFEGGDPVVASGPPNDWLSNLEVLARILDRYAIELG